MELYIYVETGIGGGVYKSISPTYFKINLSPKGDKVKNDLLEAYKKIYPKERLISEHKKAMKKRSLTELDIKNVELVYLKKGPWIKGEYYAHEYPEEESYVLGKARLLTYSNGFEEYEVKCLDQTKRVADGIWEEYGSNGMGDRFYPYESLK